MIVEKNTKLENVLSLPYIPLSSSLIYSLLAIWLVPRRFTGNDNFGYIQEIQANVSTIYFSPMLAKVLSILHVHVSSVTPWYGLLLYACLVISHLLVTWSIWQLKIQLLIRFIILTASLLLITYFYHSNGYNSASIILSGSAILAFLSIYNSTRSSSQISILLLGVCIGVAYLLRSKGVYAASVFMAPTCMLFVLAKPKRVLKSTSILFLPVLVVIILNTAYIRWGTTDVHKEYMAWNEVRAKFQAYPVQKEQQDNHVILELNNWTPLNYEMLCTYMYFDENLYNISTLNTILEQPSPKRVKNQIEIGNIIKGGVSYFHSYYLHIASFALCMAFFIGIMTSKKIALYLGGYFFYFAILVSGMMCFFRFPDRIGYPLNYVGILNVLAIGLLYQSVPKPYTTIKKTMLGVCTLCFVLISQFYLSFLIENASDANRKSEIFEYNFNRLNEYKDKAEIVYIVAGGHGLKKRYMDPLSVCQYEILYVPTGWRSFSPRFYDALHQVGLEYGYELMPYMVDNERAIVLGEYTSLLKLIEYLKEVHKIECELELIESLQGGPSLFTIKRKQDILAL